MPVMGGFEVVRELKAYPLPILMIVTAFDRYAIEAFEAGAVDSLLKPVNERRLQKALARSSKHNYLATQSLRYYRELG